MVANVTVGTAPVGLAYDSGKGEVFVGNYASNTASVISDASNKVIANVTVGSGPIGLAYDSAKGEVFVTNQGSNTVSVISDTISTSSVTSTASTATTTVTLSGSTITTTSTVTSTLPGSTITTMLRPVTSDPAWEHGDLNADHHQHHYYHDDYRAGLGIRSDGCPPDSWAGNRLRRQATLNPTGLRKDCSRRTNRVLRETPNPGSGHGRGCSHMQEESGERSRQG